MNEILKHVEDIDVHTYNSIVKAIYDTLNKTLVTLEPPKTTPSMGQFLSKEDFEKMQAKYKARFN